MTTTKTLIEQVEALYAANQASWEKFLDGRPEAIPCENNPDHDHRLATRDSLDQKEIVYAPCAQCQPPRRVDWYRRAGIPPRLNDATVREYVADTEDKVNVIADVKAWVNSHREKDAARKTFLVFAGRPGTGKTHLGAASLKAFGEGWMTTPMELFRLKSRRMEDKLQTDPVEKAMHAKCLVLDEWCVGADRKDAPETWAEILDWRYQRQMPTILISNENIKEIAGTIGLPGITDRIKTDSILCTFDWQSFR